MPTTPQGLRYPAPADLVSTGPAAFQALAEDVHTYASSTYAVPVTGFGAVGDGVANDAPAILSAIAEVASGGGLVLFPPGTYRWASPDALEIPPGVVLRGHGRLTKLVRADWTINGAYIRGRGTLTAAAQTTLSADALRGATSLTVASTTGIAVGDYFLITSERAWKVDANAKAGEYVRVQAVPSATSLTIRGVLRDSYLTADGAALRRVTLHAGGGIEDLLLTDAEPELHAQGFVEFQYARDITISNVHAVGCGGTAFYLDGVLDSRVQGCSSIDQPDGGGLLGYGVDVNGPCEGVVVDAFAAARSRHAFTTTAGVGQYGVPRNIVVSNGTARQMTGIAWDTHPDGEDILFANCSVSGCRHAGFGIRSLNSKVQGGQVSGAGSGVWITGAAHRTVIDGLHIHDTYDISGGHGSGIRVAGGTAAPEDVLIKDVVIDETDYAGIVVSRPDSGAAGIDPVRLMIRNAYITNPGRKNFRKAGVVIDDLVVPTDMRIIGLHVANTRPVGLARAAVEKSGTTGLTLALAQDITSQGLTSGNILLGVNPQTTRRNVRRTDALDPLLVPEGVQTKVTDTAITDADFPAAPPDGTVAFDRTARLLYVRLAGIWRQAALT